MLFLNFVIGLIGPNKLVEPTIKFICVIWIVMLFIPFSFCWIVTYICCFLVDYYHGTNYRVKKLHTETYKMFTN